MTYRGEFRNDQMHGRISRTARGRESSSVYSEGKYLHGNGTVLDESGAMYEGEFGELGVRNGFGVYTWADGSAVYTGQWRNDRCSGHGVKLFSNGEREEGEWKDGKLTGLSRGRAPGK